jgi:hypothetical protein
MERPQGWPPPPAPFPLPCVKCGSVIGWDGPKYAGHTLSDGHEWFESIGRLVFECRTCGYKRSEPTKDASPDPIIQNRAYDVLPSDDAPVRWWQFWR